MATFTVMNTNDSGAGSLRQAISDAATAAGADSIIFDASLMGGTITLSSGELAIAGAGKVTISGDINGDGGADITISGNSSSGILNVAGGSQVALTALNFTAAQATASSASVPYSGAVVNAGTLSITTCNFINNTATGFAEAELYGASVGSAIFNGSGATLTVTETAFSSGTATAAAGGTGAPAGWGGNAGAILNFGTLALAHVLFENNTSSAGNGGSTAGGFTFQGGAGGSAAGAVFNTGTVSGTFLATGNTAIAGSGGGGSPPGTAGNANNAVLNAGTGTNTASGGDHLGTMAADSKLDLGQNSYYYGLSGDDTIMGGPGSHLYGGAGNDTLTSNGSGVTLEGGKGDDIYIVQGASDIIIEKAGDFNDRVQALASFALAADDSIEFMTTVNATDTTAINLTGNASVQSITGNAGNNVLDGGVDNLEDDLVGLGGNDTYVLHNSLMDNVVDLEGIDTITSTISRDLGNHQAIEKLVLLGKAAIDGFGNGLKNTITGNGAVNHLSGGLGADKLFGMAGNDVLQGNAGMDALDGGAGQDRASFSDEKVSVVVTLKDNGAAVNATLGGIKGDSLKNIENLSGGSTGDKLTGNSSANALTGNGGSDVLNGKSGNDTLTGGAGNDVFRFDVLHFGADKVTDFSDGHDRLSFGTSVASHFSEFAISANNTTTVTVHHGVDKIVLHSAVAIHLSAADFLFA